MTQVNTSVKLNTIDIKRRSHILYVIEQHACVINFTSGRWRDHRGAKLFKGGPRHPWPLKPFLCHSPQTTAHLFESFSFKLVISSCRPAAVYPRMRGTSTDHAVHVAWGPRPSQVKRSALSVSYTHLTLPTILRV